MPSLRQHVLGTGNVRKSWTYRTRLHVKAFTDKGDCRHGTGKKVGAHDFLSTACLTIEFLSKVTHFFWILIISIGFVYGRIILEWTCSRLIILENESLSSNFKELDDPVISVN